MTQPVTRTCTRPHPADVEQIQWLAADDFSQPLQAGLWQSLTALAYRRAAVDPITVLWEAQQRALLKPDVEPAKLLDLLASPAGSLQHWGELILQRSLLTTAHQVGCHVQALTRRPDDHPVSVHLRRSPRARASILRAHPLAPGHLTTANDQSPTRQDDITTQSQPTADNCSAGHSYLPLSPNPTWATLVGSATGSSTWHQLHREHQRIAERSWHF
ncbi:DnaB-like helicase N-terminal domain-containing protein [Streptomyces sp. NPDC093272]|uniref:DnaB-like helicase N-terminal domain-containing protein n=1 Tax=Streptomyces sp. NPDC093272 TaxID=3154981 RepID=UPI00342AA75A